MYLNITVIACETVIDDTTFDSMAANTTPPYLLSMNKAGEHVAGGAIEGGTDCSKGAKLTHQGRYIDRCSSAIDFRTVDQKRYTS